MERDGAQPARAARRQVGRAPAQSPRWPLAAAAATADGGAPPRDEEEDELPELPATWLSQRRSVSIDSEASDISDGERSAARTAVERCSNDTIGSFMLDDSWPSSPMLSPREAYDKGQKRFPYPTFQLPAPRIAKGYE